MLQQLENDIKKIILSLYKDIDRALLDKLILELPPEKLENDVDISTNIALILSKAAKKNPMEIANEMVAEIQKIDYVSACEVVKPAFINIKLKDNILFAMVEDICQNGDKNLVKNLGNGEKANVEFCSANPTGPLHIGHARGTIFGDTLASLLSKSGYDVCREYYINDAGGQMDKLEKSIQWRINGAQGELPDGCYPGEYLQEIADKRKKELAKNPTKQWSKIETAGEIIDNFIKPTLKKLKVNYNQWSSEQHLKDEDTIEKSIRHLTDLGLIYQGILEPPKGKPVEDYEPREQLLFKSSQFGDDTDRPLAKSDGSHTYFASDIAYHYDKWKRGFNNMVVVLGADHKGYVKRLTSAVKAISNNQGEVHIKLCELVNFMKNGEMVKMSKRKNNFLTIDDVIDEIDVDILRFIILTRKADTVLNFDLQKAKEQSKDNPIWYIQYANARCNSVLKKAAEQGILPAENLAADGIELSQNFHKMMIKMSFYTRFLELAVKNYEPFFFANYLIQLATEFHTLYEKEKFISDDKAVSAYKLAIVKSIQLLIQCGLDAFRVQVVVRM
ncbi:MAG: arginine--tRNA ligase [Rickettsiales bacterium]|nr:arginine--tRNA ligase [Rickettsiales bacterium]